MKFLSKIKSTLVIAVSCASVVALNASAVLPTWATDMLDDAATAGTDSAAGVGPVIGGVLVATIIIKLIKRFAGKI